MDIQFARSFFMWCTILNTGLLLFAFGFLASAGGWVHRLHGRWFPMSREAFNLILYGVLAAMKILVLVFNLVPFLVLCIIG